MGGSEESDIYRIRRRRREKGGRLEGAARGRRQGERAGHCGKERDGGSRVGVVGFCFARDAKQSAIAIRSRRVWTRCWLQEEGDQKGKGPRGDGDRDFLFFLVILGRPVKYCVSASHFGVYSGDLQEEDTSEPSGGDRVWPCLCGAQACRMAGQTRPRPRPPAATLRTCRSSLPAAGCGGRAWDGGATTTYGSPRIDPFA